MIVSGRCLLLVEGPDDKHVFYHLSRYYQVHDQFTIKEKGGIDNLLNTLDVELLGSELERLGIVIDADVDLEARWHAMRNRLTNSGYSNVPVKPNAGGTIIEQGEKPIVGVWVMPDNTFPGMLEDFISFLVPEEDQLWERVEECVEQIPEQDRHFPPEHRIKAHIHTWLAWQEEPGKPLGQAITKRYLDADAPHAQQLMNWIRRLFDLETS